MRFKRVILLLPVVNIAYIFYKWKSGENIFSQKKIKADRIGNNVM